MALLPPIKNPDVPYTGEIDKGFTPGEMVRIQGQTLPNTNRFTINLQCGPNCNPRDEVALHVSVRVAENYLVLNTKIGGSWGKEVIPEIPLPIGLDQHFEMLILTDEDHYKLAVNGFHYAEFEHRMPGGRVSHLNIEGDVKVTLICYEGGVAPPQETSADAGISYSETPKDNIIDELSLDDFKPSAPRTGGPGLYPQLPGGGAPGGIPGYGPPGGAPGYGPPGGAPGYGPPAGAPGYGPPGGSPYGAPQGYGPGPGQAQPETPKGPGAFEAMLGQAGTAIAGALASGALNNMLKGGNQPPQQNPVGSGYPGYQGPGQGPLQSLLSSLTSGGGGQQAGAGGGAAGLLGGLLSSALSQPSQQGGGGGGYQPSGGYGQPQQQQQQPSQNQGGGLGGFLSGALSSLTSGQRHNF